MSCLSVVIPAHNEEQTLSQVVSRVLAIPEVTEVVIVNDCSTDRTGVLADGLSRKDLRLRVVQRECPVDRRK
jgi:glycosyltransferase involved in cell wall biosynthesis